MLRKRSKFQNDIYVLIPLTCKYTYLPDGQHKPCAFLQALSRRTFSYTKTSVWHEEVTEDQTREMKEMALLWNLFPAVAFPSS